MQLPRVQAVELHDLPQCPAFVRETIVESLGNALRWGRIYDPAADAFWEFCRQAQVTRVLDLCSGTGEPVSILLDALARHGVPAPRFAVSDLYPNAARLRGVAARHPEHVEVIVDPVDATAVPASVDREARTIISAFHHFPPPLAARIVADCVAKRRALFVLEPVRRSPMGGMGLVPWLAAAALANPFIAPEQRVAKLLSTYASPISAAAMAWDSIVSMLRMYTEDELMDLVAGTDGYEWHYRAIPVRRGVEVTVFMGWPSAASAPGGA